MSCSRIVALASGLLFSVAQLGCHSADAAKSGEVADRVEGDRVILAPGSRELTSLAVSAVTPAGPDTVRLNGRLVWDENVTVRVFAPFSGRVVRVVADAGQSVRAGDTLAVIESPDFGAAQAEARRAATDLGLADRTLTRTRDLYAHGVVAQKEVLGAEADLARATAEAQRAKARIALYGGDSASVSQRYALRSPLGGTVVERNLTPGQEVRPDQMLANAPQLFAPLFVVTDPSHLWVQLDLAEREVGVARPGASVDVRPQAWPDRAVRGRITIVGDAIDPTTRTVKVRGSVDNSKRALKAEMLVTVALPSASTSAATIPAAAVVLAGDQHVVFVEEERGRYRRVAVTIGEERDGGLVSVSGLRVGEQVVSGGALLLEQLFRQ